VTATLRPHGKINSYRWADLAFKILDGFDYRQMKRLCDEIPPPAERSVDGKTFTQQSQESKGNSWDG
jgi:hypothetical protein